MDDVPAISPDRAPWQAWVCTSVIATLLAMVWVEILPLAAQLIANAIHVALHQPFGTFTAKIMLLLLVPLYMIGLSLVWALGVVAFVRGRPWGLITAFASLAVLFYLLGASIVYANLKGSTNISYPIAALIFILLLAVGKLLLSNSTRTHCSASHWRPNRLIATGMLLGALIWASYIGAAYSLLLFVPWLKGG